MTRWALPEFISDVLPAQARRIEGLRRSLLDLFASYGYEWVIPPLMEYVDSLMTGTGHDMDLRTFKLVDQLSGRTMGLRADMTPQATRIDAHLLNRAGVTRLAYCGPVLHTRPAGLAETREPLQIGAELYGHAGIEADIEVQRLLLEALSHAGIAPVRLDLGHVGVFRALSERAGLDAETSSRLFGLMQSKDVPQITQLTANLAEPWREALRTLPQLYGDARVLGEARERFPSDPAITAALADLSALASAIPEASLSFDLAELRGYQYHSGVVFSAYAPGRATAIARGGRYDEVGRAFGRARPATGFSLDLRELATLMPEEALCVGILAPWQEAPRLREKIASLRASGEVVVHALPGHDKASWQPCCNRELMLIDGEWQVRPLTQTHSACE